MNALFPRYCFVLLVALIVQWICAPQLYAADGEPTLEVAPQKVEINSFYHGTTLAVKGTVPANSKIALVLVGEKKTQTLKRKGKVGPLWMNVDTVTIKGAPEMYYLATSTDTQEELAPSEVLARYTVGYGALRESITIEQGNSDYDSTFREFIKLKESAELYRTVYNSIKLKPMAGNLSKFEVLLPIPALAPPGEYKVFIYCFEEGRLFSSASSKLTVEKVGLPEKLSTLAVNHAALYGILAVVAAIAAGLFMGVLFGSKGKGGH